MIQELVAISIGYATLGAATMGVDVSQATLVDAWKCLNG